MSDYIDSILKQAELDRQIKCPYCGNIQANDDGQYPVSYHGEDGPVVETCDECGAEFYVEEIVSRTYLVGKGVTPSGSIIEVDESNTPA
mgnify:CR=1 FL=1